MKVLTLSDGCGLELQAFINTNGVPVIKILEESSNSDWEYQLYLFEDLDDLDELIKELQKLKRLCKKII